MHIYSPSLFFCRVKWVLGYVLFAYGLVFYFSGSGDAFLGLRVAGAAQRLTGQLLQPGATPEGWARKITTVRGPACE